MPIKNTLFMRYVPPTEEELLACAKANYETLKEEQEFHIKEIPKSPPIPPTAKIGIEWKERPKPKSIVGHYEVSKVKVSLVAVLGTLVPVIAALLSWMCITIVSHAERISHIEGALK